MTNNSPSDPSSTDRSIGRYPGNSIEDQVWNAVVAQTTNMQPPPKRVHIIRILCDIDKHDPYDPDVINDVIDRLIDEGKLTEAPDGRIRFSSKGEEV